MPVRQLVHIIDDAEIGIDPVNQSLFDMSRQAGFGRKEWTAVLIALGLSSAGTLMVMAAILSPEPTRKLGLLVLGGSVVLLTGGLTAIRILTGLRPPSVEVTPTGFRVIWE